MIKMLNTRKIIFEIYLQFTGDSIESQTRLKWKSGPSFQPHTEEKINTEYTRDDRLLHWIKVKGKRLGLNREIDEKREKIAIWWIM